jgi:hypothetical protein
MSRSVAGLKKSGMHQGVSVCPRRLLEGGFMSRVVPTLLTRTRLTVLSAALTFAAFGVADSQGGISALEQPDHAATVIQLPSSPAAAGAEQSEYTNEFANVPSTRTTGIFSQTTGLAAPSAPSTPEFSDVESTRRSGPFQMTVPSFVGPDILPGDQDEADGTPGFGGVTSTRSGGGASAIPSPSAVVSGLTGFAALGLLAIAKRVRRAIRSY